jgi:hypothetical protein
MGSFQIYKLIWNFISEEKFCHIWSHLLKILSRTDKVLGETLIRTGPDKPLPGSGNKLLRWKIL